MKPTIDDVKIARVWLRESEYGVNATLSVESLCHLVALARVTYDGLKKRKRRKAGK